MCEPSPSCAKAAAPLWVCRCGRSCWARPICLADNAAFLATLGPAGIDLNFGCPAKIVDRHGGGAALLQEPELVHRIVREVRRAVPTSVPVSAKMRLGFHDDAQAEDCARAIADERGGQSSWWCTPAPRPMATARRLTGSASPM